MVRFFIFSKGRLIQQSSDLAFLKVALYEENVDVWVDAEKPTKEETKTLLEDVFAFHPLAIEDCITASERPKIDQYDGYFFMVIHAVAYTRGQEAFGTTELNMFIGKNFLVTFHEEALRCIVTTVERMNKNPAQVARSPDRLTYYILDQLFDGYEPTLNEVSQEIGELERSVLTSASMNVLNDIVHLKGQVQQLRQLISPQREVISRLAHGDFAPVRSSMLPYYRDLLDRLSHISDVAENYRESLSNTVQILLGLQQGQINHVIKVLTVLATLSMPILIVTSYYGMNIQHMPNTNWPSWPLAYLWILGLTAMITAVVYLVLRRKNWL